MSKGNITPGEWIVDYQGTKGHIKAVGGLGEHTPTVCRYDVWSKYGVESPYNQYEKSNAKLIAASPKMKETLTDCAETMNVLLIELKKDEVILRHEIQSRLSQIEKTLKEAGFSL